MSYAATVLRRGMRRVLLAQALLALAAALAFGLFGGPNTPLAVIYGGAIALLITLLLGWRVQRAGEVGASSATGGTLLLYLGALERFIVVLAGLALGMGWLKLSPLPMVVGFAVAQLGFLINVPTRVEKK